MNKFNNPVAIVVGVFMQSLLALPLTKKWAIATLQEWAQIPLHKFNPWKNHVAWNLREVLSKAIGGTICPDCGWVIPPDTRHISCEATILAKKLSANELDDLIQGQPRHGIMGTYPGLEQDDWIAILRQEHMWREVQDHVDDWYGDSSTSPSTDIPPSDLQPGHPLYPAYTVEFYRRRWLDQEE